jgi:hypothetical protein
MHSQSHGRFACRLLAFWAIVIVPATPVNKGKQPRLDDPVSLKQLCTGSKAIKDGDFAKKPCDLILPLVASLEAASGMSNSSRPAAEAMENKCRQVISLASVERSGHSCHPTCAYLDASSRTVSMYTVGYRAPPDWRYIWAQFRFLNDVVNRTEFTRSTYVANCAWDFGFIGEQEMQSLKRHNVVFMSHNLLAESIPMGGLLTMSFVLQPDFHFILKRGFEGLITRLAASRAVPLERKLPVVFWRGSTNGIALSCETLPRIQMALRSQKHRYLDVKIIDFSYACAQATEDLPKKTLDLINGSYIKSEKWGKYRGLIDVDGFSNAWGLVWRLCSGSVVFKVDSQFVSHATVHLTPWVHYVPLRRDFSDLASLSSIVANVSWISNLQRMIVSACNVVKEQLTYEQEVSRVAKRISSFFNR